MTHQIIQVNNNVSGSINHEHVQTFYEYTQKSKSNSSRRTYQFGWNRFTTWLSENGYSLSNSANDIALQVGMFLSALAKQRQLKPTSINTYLAAIKHHIWEMRQIELDHPEIRRAMKGIRYDMRDIRKDKKEAILVGDLHEILKPMQGSSKLIDIRDKAILLLGFSGAFRRSELAGIHLEHIQFDRDGITILLPWSKTDQSGQGQRIQIPHGKNEHTSPIIALNTWLAAAGIKSGAIFRPITKHGVIQPTQMTDRAIALIVKKRARGLFNERNVAGHSLRRGLVTSALEAKVPDTVVMRQTRHTSVNMLKEYYQDLKDYQNNALRSLNI
jgi:integrase